jgi:hypothetical protein
MFLLYGNRTRDLLRNRRVYEYNPVSQIGHHYEMIAI